MKSIVCIGTTCDLFSPADLIQNLCDICDKNVVNWAETKRPFLQQNAVFSGQPSESDHPLRPKKSPQATGHWTSLEPGSRDRCLSATLLFERGCKLWMKTWWIPQKSVAGGCPLWLKLNWMHANPHFPIINSCLQKPSPSLVIPCSFFADFTKCPFYRIFESGPFLVR